MQFIEDELQIKQDIIRHEKFHHLDSSITVDELWKIWISSQTYTWSIDDVLNWLYSNDVVLDKYMNNFKRNSVDGRFIPRLATNENGFLTKVLKIKDFRDRNKIMLKATDLVLFGQQNGKLLFILKHYIFQLTKIHSKKLKSLWTKKIY